MLNIKGKYKIKKKYIEVDKYQKNWITKYCKRNKIDRIEKIKIIRDELKIKNNDLTIKYIDPLIIATLFLNIWEVIVQKFNNKIGTINTIVVTIALVIAISVIIGIIKKEYKEQKKFLNTFNKMKGLDRLDNLLVYVALKCKK